ncbi:hypothetical protein CYMTET_42716 [Cymbomonas tetramitiformis]|uniref:Uncharacterized protein n=1 Tax=Cymbomonas tetramitiformis TaxID=36881 RepID=A0AAE0C3I7_9CHLO|nr:hypothetical protein CYMTET_42716 [Cymbomonas tetramitiformis]
MSACKETSACLQGVSGADASHRQVVTHDGLSVAQPLQDGCHHVQFEVRGGSAGGAEASQKRHGSHAPGAARRRSGGCGREERQQGARVFLYMDNCLVIASSKIPAFRACELASRVLVRLGIGRNEKEGLWGPTQLVEHFGLELDEKAGQFGVTPSFRLQRIHQQAKANLSEASRQRRTA